MKNRTFAFETWFVEFTAKYLWAAMRPLVRRHLSRRCRHCVLSEAKVTLNADGICTECETYLAQGEAGRAAADPAEAQALESLLKGAPGTGKGEFDALVLFSGGKDSSYLVHRILTEYPGMRVLTLLVDNGFMSPYAMENAQRALEKFNVAHVTYRAKPSLVRKAFHHTLTHLHTQKGYTIVDTMDAYITFDTATILAARWGIPLVICGLSKVQNDNIFGLTGFEFPRRGERSRMTDYIEIDLEQVFDEEERAMWWDGEQWPEEAIPRFVFPYCVWDLDEEFILREVDRLGLIERRRSRPLMTNNALIPVIGMAEVARFGYSSFEVEFARMVREGKSDRRYWLHIFEMLEYSTRTGRFINKTVEETLRKLDLTKEAIGIRH
jgi:hypothetical protein